MTKKEYKPQNHRIISIRQKNRILHIEDALDLDRIRFDLWDYTRGNGAAGHVDAYVERHTARALAAELATGRLTYADKLQDSGGGTVNGAITARLFLIENADTNNPIRITITSGPGAKQAGGLISLTKGAEHTRIQILLSRLDAKRIGLALLHHIQAWEILTFRDRTADTFKPNRDWSAQPNHIEQVLCPTCHSRPCICDDLPHEIDPDTGDPQTPNNVGADLNLRNAGVRPGDDPILRYANGDEVTDNDHEIQAYRAYVTAEKALPKDVDTLRQWVLDTPKWPRMPPNATEN